MNVFEINGPEPILFAQKCGVIVIVQKRSDFDKAMKAEHGIKYMTRRIRELQSFDHLSFSGRPGLPHLLADGGTLDISTAGLWRALTTLAVHRNRDLVIPDNLTWLFDPHTARFCRARDWFERVYPALMLQSPPPSADTVEHHDYQRVQADGYARDFWSTFATITKHHGAKQPQ